MSRNISTYRGFKLVLISLAVEQFGYDRDEITKMVHNDEYKLYYDEGETPFMALQLDERNTV